MVIPKILLIMEMLVILFLKHLEISICSYGETTFIIQAKALTRIFKEIINLEPYLLLLNKNHRSIFTHYRTARHRLPIEFGRWELFPEVNENAICVRMMLLVMNITFYLNAIFFRNKRCQYLPKYYYIII